MLNFLWNVLQERKIHNIEKKNFSKENKILKTASQISDLTTQVEKLTLITHALWEIVKKETKRTDEDIVSLMTELDLQDGVLESKITLPARKCPKCGRAYQQGRRNCIFCGTPNPNPSPFEV